MIHRSNGFDGLRLVAAAMVIFGHAFPLTGHTSPGLFANGVQTIGVKVFFVISGYLITKSWLSDPDLRRFWTKRALRIMPGLFAVCMISILVVGPLFTELPILEYFRNGRTIGYASILALYPQYDLPDVFVKNIYPNVVNGSLWSLPIEIAMYCGVPLLVGRYGLPGRIYVAVATVGLFAASIYFVRIAPPATPPVIWGSSLISTLDVAYYFYAGASIAIFRLDRYFDAYTAGVVFVIASWLPLDYVWGEVVLALTLPYFVVSLGKIRSALLVRLDGHDYSYGLYLYGFVVQQIIVHLMGPSSALLNAAIALPITAICAAISWFLVEKRALGFKPEVTKQSEPAELVRAHDVN